MYEKYIENLIFYVDDMFEEINLMINEMSCCIIRLKEIELRLDFLLVVEYIDLMI